MTISARDPLPAQPPPSFGALRYRNFRLFLIGQFISLSGTWIQRVAVGWLVLQLSNSAFTVGLVSALGSLPILLFSLYGGVIADRVNRHRLILILQSLMLLEATSLGILQVTGHISVPWVAGLAVFFGTLSAFEVPTRQAFIVEMTDRDSLMNAIALNSSVFNVSRILGPAIAGVLIASVGLAACFFVNAASYIAVITGLLLMRLPPYRRELGEQPRRAFREGMAYMLGEPWPRRLVILTGTFSVFGAAFIPMLPVLAREVLKVGASGYGTLVSASGVGASAAALFLAAFGHRLPRRRVLLFSGLMFGAGLISASFFDSFWLALALLTVAGTAMVGASVLTNTLLQTEAPDQLRGRVMGVYSFLVLGLSPFGAFQAGWVAEHFGVQWSFRLGGIICMIVAAGVIWSARKPGKGKGEQGTGRTSVPA